MEKIVPFEKGELCYTVKGEGKAIVLLHGFLEDHTMWDTIAAQLTNSYKVISVDLPGFGNTDVYNESNSMAFMANVVYYALIEENVDQCIMVGHSMGGYTTLEFANLYPDKLKGIVLFHSHAAADDEEAKINRDRTINIVKSDHLGFIQTFIPSLFAESNISKFDKQINELRETAKNTSRAGIIAALTGMRDRNDHTKLLNKLELPVFFIIGKQDPKIPMDKIIPQLALPANCEALMLDHVGHMGFIEAQQHTLAAVEHFAERYL